METECFDSGKDNLLNVAKGVYNAMQIARDDKSGSYYNAINFNWFKSTGSARTCRMQSVGPTSG